MTRTHKGFRGLFRRLARWLAASDARHELLIIEEVTPTNVQVRQLGSVIALPSGMTIGIPDAILDIAPSNIQGQPLVCGLLKNLGDGRFQVVPA